MTKSTLLKAAFVQALLVVPQLAQAGVVAGAGEGQIVSQVPVAGGVELQLVASGNATRMASFTRTETLVLDPLTTTFTGTVTFTAGNGDTLSGAVVGEFVGPGTATGTYEWTSGSGRFAHPVGTTRFVVLSQDGVDFQVQFKGSLSVVQGEP